MRALPGACYKNGDGLDTRSEPVGTRLNARAAFALSTLALVSATPASAVVGPSADGAAFAQETVMVLTRGPEGSGYCTGVVLSPRAILTAAHCLRPASDMLVHFRDADGAPVVIAVTAALAHPDYRPDARVRRVRSIDVGLIETSEPLPPRFHAAEIAEGPPPAPGDGVEIVGYGLQREGEAKSGGRLRALRVPVREPRSQVLLWIGPGGGACSGDSGGPIYGVDGASVFATVAWTEGEHGLECGSLTQGVLLAPLRAWIESAIQRWAS